MRSEIFYNEGYFHIYNRGVEKRDLFLDNDDRVKFLASITKINDHFDPYVSIHSFCLMNNHFHFLVQQKQDVGISKFMQRLCNSYAKYFNKKRKRSGRLFEAPFKAKEIVTDEYFIHLSRYIHLNPIELVRGGKLERLRAIERYEWSSYGYFLDQAHIPFVDKRKVMSFFKNMNDYRDFIHEWIHDYDKLKYSFDNESFTMLPQHEVLG
jgi:putative transposase